MRSSGRCPGSAALGGRGGLEAGQVLAPGLGNVLGGEPDEEDGCRRPRHGAEAHARLLEQPVALAMVARCARGDDVLPDRCAATRARDDVVERQAVAAGSAVPALPAVPGEQHAAGDPPGHRARHAHVCDQPDDVRTRERRRRGAELAVACLEDLGTALPDEHVRTTERADVQRLVACIEDEYALHRAGSVAPGACGKALRETAFGGVDRGVAGSRRLSIMRITC